MALTYDELERRYKRLLKRDPKAAPGFLKEHPKFAAKYKAAELAKQIETVTGPDGIQYTINTKTGVVTNEQGQRIAGVFYNPNTGEFSVPGYDTIDLKPKLGAPTPGQTYERNFDNERKWFELSQGDKAFFVNKGTGRAFDETGKYIGDYDEDLNEISFFAAPEEIGEPEEEEPGPDVPTAEQEDAHKVLQDFLGQLGLTNLTDFAWQAIREGWSDERVLNELRQTDEYKQAFPEYWERIQKGLKPMNEGEIINYRSEAKRLVRQTFGAELSNTDISKALTNDWSLQEFEHRVMIAKHADENRYVKQIMELELDRPISDQEFMDFLNDDIETSGLDKAYEQARYRSVAMAYNLGPRSAEEVEALKALGISEQEATGRYRNVAEARPLLEKLGGIETGISLAAALADTPIEMGIAGLLLDDPEARQQINSLVAREFARFAQKGGAIQTQGGQQVGLLTPNQQRRLT